MYDDKAEARSKSESHKNGNKAVVGRFMEYGDAEGERDRATEEVTNNNRTYNKSLFSRFKAVDFIDQ